MNLKKSATSKKTVTKKSFLKKSHHEKNSRKMKKVIGDRSFLSSLAANDYTMDGFGGRR